MTAMFPNRAGSYVGEALWDAQAIIGDMDPQWIGYYFDPSQATAEGGVSGWEIALRLALPRLKAVALQDFTWVKAGNSLEDADVPHGRRRGRLAGVFPDPCGCAVHGPGLGAYGVSRAGRTRRDDERPGICPQAGETSLGNPLMYGGHYTRFEK